VHLTNFNVQTVPIYTNITRVLCVAKLFDVFRRLGRS